MCNYLSRNLENWKEFCSVTNFLVVSDMVQEGVTLENLISSISHQSQILKTLSLIRSPEGASSLSNDPLMHQFQVALDDLELRVKETRERVQRERECLDSERDAILQNLRDTVKAAEKMLERLPKHLPKVKAVQLKAHQQQHHHRHHIQQEHQKQESNLNTPFTNNHKYADVMHDDLMNEQVEYNHALDSLIDSPFVVSSDLKPLSNISNRINSSNIHAVSSSATKLKHSKSTFSLSSSAVTDTNTPGDGSSKRIVISISPLTIHEVNMRF